MNNSVRVSIMLPVSLIIWIALVCLAMPGFAAAAGPDKPHPVDSVTTVNPGSDLWREVRQRDLPARGSTQIKSVDSDVLINPWGDPWARLRSNQVQTLGGLLLGGVLAVILLFYMLRGRIRVAGGFSGHRLQRFRRVQIVAHWLLAGSFLFLGLTGLILLFGRSLLIPLIGQPTFSVLASLSLYGHNFVGPLFLLSVLTMLVVLVRRNLYEKGDLQWLLTAGGALGKTHPSIGFFNAGEKCLFWLVIGLGLVISASGLVLVTPIFGQGRVIMEAAHLVHVISTLGLIALSFIHMYLGLFGIEGALESMKSGYVDINWAQEHHDRWARECRERGEVITSDDADRKAGGSPLSSAQPAARV